MLGRQKHNMVPLLVKYNKLFFWIFRAVPKAYGSSQARGRIGVAAASLRHSRSNAGFLTHWARPGIKPQSSWVLVGFVTTEPQQELPNILKRSHRHSTSASSVQPLGISRESLGGWGQGLVCFLKSSKIYDKNQNYCFNHFPVSSSVVSSIPTLLCKGSPALFHLAKLKLYTH